MLGCAFFFFSYGHDFRSDQRRVDVCLSAALRHVCVFSDLKGTAGTDASPKCRAGLGKDPRLQHPRARPLQAPRPLHVTLSDFPSGF